MKLWWFFWFFWILSKPKPSLTLLRTLYSFIHDNSFCVKLFHENVPTPSLYFFLITMSHMTTMCTCFVFFYFIKLFMLICIWICENVFWWKWPYTKFIFFLVTMSCKSMNYEGFLFFWFLSNYLWSFQIWSNPNNPVD